MAEASKTVTHAENIQQSQKNMQNNHYHDRDSILSSSGTFAALLGDETTVTGTFVALLVVETIDAGTFAALLVVETIDTPAGPVATSSYLERICNTMRK